MLATTKIFLLSQDNKTLQRAIYIGVAIITLLLLSTTVASRNFYHSSTARHKQQFQELQWMTEQQMLVEAFRANTAPTRATSDDSLISVVTTTAEKHGVVLSRYRPGGNSIVQLSTDNSPLRNTLEWINTLLTDHELVVSNMSLSRGDENGFCQLQIEFRTQGAKQL